MTQTDSIAFQFVSAASKKRGYGKVSYFLVSQGGLLSVFIWNWRKKIIILTIINPSLTQLLMAATARGCEFRALLRKSQNL